VRGAVEESEYASFSEVVREALRDWKTKRALQLRKLSAFIADIDKGLIDLAEGRGIVEGGRQLGDPRPDGP
jgi:antitoxin ParD1/3/4